MRKLNILLYMTLIVVILSACNNEQPKEEKNERMITPVETEKVDTGDLMVAKKIYGQVSPIQQTPVMIQQPGEVTSLKVDNGDKVKKNDHLGTIKASMGSQTIYAPVDGEVAHLNVQEKGFQSNEDPFMLLINTEKLRVDFLVTENNRKNVKKDQTVKVEVNEHEYDATVLGLDPMPNDTGQYPITAEITNEDNTLLPGATAILTMSDKRVKDTIIIPTAAILTENDESYVFIVEDDTAKKVNVDISDTQSDYSAVDGELKKGDQIIVNGHFTLSDGSKVEVVKEGK